jgi:succinyl-diaminopimelate desuccinylase
MNQQEQLALLQELIQIQSVDDNEAALVDVLVALFTDEPLVQIERLTFAPGRDSVIVKIGHGEQILAFSGHLDTVAAAQPERWTYPPYSAQVHDGRLYGRGANDMKSGVAAIFAAAKNLLAQDIDWFQHQIWVMGTVGEETGFYGAEMIAQSGQLAQVAGVVLAEPTNFALNIAHKGVLDYRLQAVGTPAHSSTPEAGVNAIDHLRVAMDAISQWVGTKTIQDAQLGGLTHVFSMIGGGDAINAVPGEAWLTGNIRTIPAYSNDSVIAELKELVQTLQVQHQMQLTLEILAPQPPLADQRNTWLTQLIQQEGEKLTGHPIAFITGTGATEAAAYVTTQPDLPVAIIGSGDGQSHVIDESVSLEAYYAGVKLYEQVMQQFIQQTKSV